MRKQKTINIWLNKDLAQVLCKFNRRTNNSLFQYQLKSYFIKYKIECVSLYRPIEVTPESFNNIDRITTLLSNIVLRIKRVSNEIDYLIESLNFLRENI